MLGVFCEWILGTQNWEFIQNSLHAFINLCTCQSSLLNCELMEVFSGIATHKTGTGFRGIDNDLAYSIARSNSPIIFPLFLQPFAVVSSDRPSDIAHVKLYGIAVIRF